MSIIQSQHSYLIKAEPRFPLGAVIASAFVLASFAGFLALVLTGAILIRPRDHLAGFLAFIVVMSFLFGCICWWKGEPTRWIWGE